MPHVLSTNGWDAMRWERLRRFDPRNGGWDMDVLDTSARTRDEVADLTVTWCRRALRGQAPEIRVVAPEHP